MVGKLIKSLLWTIGTLIYLAAALLLTSAFGGWALTLIGIGAIAVISGWRSSARKQLYVETPTTYVSQSRSGRVELHGLAAAADDRLLCDPVASRPCVWFAVKSFRGRWPNERNAKPSIAMVGPISSAETILKEAVSSRPFTLRDESGVCLVDPVGAEFDMKPDAIIIDEEVGVTHLVWRIIEGQSLTVLGHFQWSVGGGKYSGRVSKPDDSLYLISYRAPAQLETS